MNSETLPNSVRIVPDEQLQFIEGAYVYNVPNQPDYVDHLVYMPHCGENFGNVGFLKLRLLCKKKAIRLSAFGHLNQFSEMGILADTIVAQPGDELLNRVYRERVSGWRVDQKVMRRVTSVPFVKTSGMTESRHNCLLNRRDLNRQRKLGITPEYREKFSLMIEAMESIDDQEVIDSFVWPEIYIRRSTWELFQSLDLPNDVICCEAKLSWDLAARTKKWLRTRGIPNVKGVDHGFQYDLLKKVGAHYMGIQFLASWLKNWMFVCIGGSDNLFSIMPVKALIMFDVWYGNSSTETCLRGLARRRYGTLGDDIPIFLRQRRKMSVASYLDQKKDTLIESIDRLRAIPYGGSELTAATGQPR